MFFFSFYVPHLAHIFVMSRKLVVRSVRFSSTKKRMPTFQYGFLVGSNFSLYFSSVLLLIVWDFTFLGTSHSCDTMTRAATTLTSMFELKLRKLDVINVSIFVTRELWTSARAPKQASDFSKHYSRFYSHNLKYCKIFSNTNFYPLLG